MDDPTDRTLVALQIAAAISAQAQTTIDGLDGAAALTLDCDFKYGSGGTSCTVWAQASPDGGTTWRDIARFDFTTASRAAVANLSGLTAKGVSTYAPLVAEGVNDGYLQPSIRGVVTSVGTYVNTTVALRATPR